MALDLGVRLGPYEIVAPIGAGGMGEVYRARDTRLSRDVAIKILAGPLASDPSRRERFEREARIISSLNHPNICALYDIGIDSGRDFLVLELLEGEPLDRRLARTNGRPLPMAQALAIAMQIADALDRAHRAGIVHRDLKPHNIFLTKAGAKLLDFGLAKVAGGPIAAQPVAAIDATAPRGTLSVDGTIIGTFLYMAPEQLSGGVADVRTDIFALGLVLYEMLTGRRPFENYDEAGVITAVFEREPPELSAAVAELPPSLDRIVRTCLAKDPDDRFQSAHDVLIQLQWAAEPTSDATQAVRATRSVRRWQMLAVASVLVAALFAGRTWLIDRRPAPADPTRFAYQLPPDQTFTRAGRQTLAISPDGTRLIYAANGQIYLKSIGDLDATPIRGTDEDPSSPLFSPNGDWILYWSRRTGELRKMPITGGTSTPLAHMLNPWGSSWSGDRIFVSQGRDGIREIPASGGPGRTVVTGSNEEMFYGPELLADGDTLIVTVKPKTASRWDDAEIVAVSITSGARTLLVRGGTDAHVAPGALVYMHEGAIMAVPFDARRVAVTGAATTLVNGVSEASASITGAGFYDFSKTGTLVYVSGATRDQRTLVLVDRKGRETVVPAGTKPYTRVRFSPDGSHLALDVRELDGDVWVWDRNREVATRLTYSRADERDSIWTADGRRILYMSDAGGTSGIYRAAPDGSGTPERLTTCTDIQAPIVVSPDGKVLVLYELQFGTARYQIKSLELDGDRTPHTMITIPFPDPSIVFSPDGQWVAYASNDSGRSEVYVQRFPTHQEAPIQISKEGGATPVWPRQGHELLYMDPARNMVSVPVKTGTTFTAGTPEVLFQANYLTLQVGRAFDVSDDGRRFAMIKEPQQASGRQFVFVEHWLDEVARTLR